MYKAINYFLIETSSYGEYFFSNWQ